MWPDGKRWRDCTWRDWRFMVAVYVFGIGGMVAALLTFVVAFPLPK